MSLELEQELENTYVMHTFARKPVCFVRGSGMYAFDDKGKQYLDFLAGIGALSLGHCYPKVTKALVDQAQKLVHVGNYYYIEQRGEVAKQISNLLNFGCEDKSLIWQSFFANSGAEANECALKLARAWARRNTQATGSAQVAGGAQAAASAPIFGNTHQVGNAPQAGSAPHIILTLEKSFHGRTLATLAATAQPSKQELFQPLPNGFMAIPANNIEALEAVFESQGENICGFLLEPIQGESGVHSLEKKYLQRARELTTKYDALLMFDEVQCGIFRTGTPFAFQQLGVIPDVVSIAKGVASGFPCGVCAARSSVAAAFEPGDHGSTFGGSSLAIAAIHATLTELQEGRFADKVKETSAYFRDALSKIPQVKEVRGKGLMLAAELSENAPCAPDVVSHALEEGLILNATGPSTLRFLPPLICEKMHVDELIPKLSAILEEHK